MPSLPSRLLIGLTGLAVSASALVAPAASAHPRSGVVDHPVRTTGCGHASPTAAGVTAPQTVVSGGLTRTFLLHVPAGYHPRRPLPLVLAYHGRKGDGYDIESFSGLDALHAVVVYPVGLPGEEDKTAWEGAPYASGADDVLFTSDLISTLQRQLCIDPGAIYVTGKSNGGGFVGVLACRLAGRIAAFAAVSGAFYDDGSTCAPHRAVPIMEFHGTGDTVVDYQGEPANNLPAIPDWMAGWAARDHCDAVPRTIFAKDDVTGLEWQHCARGAQVIHYRIEGANHTWPGGVAKSGPGVVTRTISATAIMWEFFGAHRLDAGLRGGPWPAPARPGGR